ncbi:hypothetical protein HBI80_100440 [Parastagonospora nodorum]|nr:hypothetical protein HBI80_100440 [Parastagonospora nodorum]KAH6470153.1 hypothetical protein HBI59_039280 [Parastagonospora nodorum]
MPHAPEALYSFTIPSIYDDTALDCRVYHPDTLSAAGWTTSGPGQSSRMRGIIMAHPYAPMGGSYDDRVVGIVVDEFLKAGWVVGTFNFRGAHGSKARTSWSGKPELDDYTSFAAFFMHYLSYLKPCPKLVPLELSPVVSEAEYHESFARQRVDEGLIVILGGYSYGSHILRHLPPVPSVLQPFVAPIAGSASDEILLRARKLADQSNVAWRDLVRNHERESRPRKKGHEPKHSVTMGGEETTPEKRRTSREVRRSTDRRLSVELGNRLRSLSHGHRRHKDDSPPTPLETHEVAPIVMPEVRYLLISPLTPPISTLAAPALGHKFWHKPKGSSEEVVAHHIGLAVYGDQDIFTSARRIRDWSEQLKAMQGSRFSSVEVADAGHFWVESGVEEKLRGALREWEAGLR